jgi:hypothetical protein
MLFEIIHGKSRGAKPLLKSIVPITIALTSYQIKSIPCEDNQCRDLWWELKTVRNPMGVSGLARYRQTSWEQKLL